VCCRYWTEESPELREIVNEMNRSPLLMRWGKQVKPYGEIRPTDIVPVIASNRNGMRSVFPMKWGFTGRMLLVNARSESAAKKETFRGSWQLHRCIIPATCYFEWEHITGSNGKIIVGDKYMIGAEKKKSTNKEINTWLCGLYRMEEGLPVFVVLTREASDEIRFIHHRMPLMLPGEYVNEWIRPGAEPEEIARHAIEKVSYIKAG